MMNFKFKFALIILCVFISISGITQNSIRNQVDDKGRKQGYWKQYDPMGYVSYVGQFIDDKPYGEFTYYYPNAKIRAISIMKKRGKISYTKLYHRNSKLMAEGKYYMQKKDSIWNYYSEYDGILLSTEFYVKSSREGIWKNYYPNKAVAEEFIYENNQRQGSWKQYYTDGKIRLESNYLNNKKSGLFKSFHLNGQIETQGNYKNDLKDGIWIEYDENGKRINETTYSNGSII